MVCRICGSERINVIYDDYIRDGEYGSLTQDKYKMYRCMDCGTIWHDNIAGQNKNYYESTDYRKSIGDKDSIIDFYNRHDEDVINKLNYIGTKDIRGKVIADIGCGGGSVVDFLSGVASKIVAIEPSEKYRLEMSKKGYITYAYAEDAIKEGVEADIVLSFDVIEHVDDPFEFMTNVKRLMKPSGKAIIGTPTDAPILRFFGEHSFEQFYYRYAHPWIFSKESFFILCEKAGFNNIEIKNVQLYGLSNLLNWIKYNKPRGDYKYDVIPSELEYYYKYCIEAHNLGDSMIAYLN